MSRLVVFGKDNCSQGEFTAFCERGWALGGNLGVNAGGSVTVTIPDSVAEQTWMQFGNMVLVQDDELPAWVGMIDTPWTATLPAQVTLYNIEYLL